MGSNDEMTSDIAMQELTFRGCTAEKQSSTFRMNALNLPTYKVALWTRKEGKDNKRLKFSVL